MTSDLSEYWWNWVGIDTYANKIVTKFEVSQNRTTGEAFLAYTTFPTEWKKGYAKEACSHIIEHLFNTCGTKKVIIEMDVKNKASIALAESLGAKKVAYNAKVQLIREQWSDEYRYEIAKL